MDRMPINGAVSGRGGNRHWGGFGHRLVIGDERRSSKVKVRQGFQPDPVTRERTLASGTPPIEYVFGAQRRIVGQICNLSYRRFVIGKASESSNALVLAGVPQNTILRSTDYKLITNLRYAKQVDFLNISGAVQRSKQSGIYTSSRFDTLQSPMPHESFQLR
jgi:hypothetical protein